MFSRSAYVGTTAAGSKGPCFLWVLDLCQTQQSSASLFFLLDLSETSREGKEDFKVFRLCGSRVYGSIVVAMS